MKESVIQRLIIAWLKTNDIFCWRNNSVGVYDETSKSFRSQVGVGALNGVSDILGVLNDGRLLAIEVKTQVGILSPAQSKFINAVNDRGGVAFVARSLDDAKTQLQRIIDGKNG